jgi:hypothetical protein
VTQPSFPSVPVAFHDEKTHRRILAEASNRHNNGKFNCTLVVTLNASATITVISDQRMGANSFLGFMPQTADAATALAAGIYVTAQKTGSATLNHASNSAIDQTFTLGIFG